MEKQPFIRSQTIVLDMIEKIRRLISENSPWYDNVSNQREVKFGMAVKDCLEKAEFMQFESPEQSFGELLSFNKILNVAYEQSISLKRQSASEEDMRNFGLFETIFSEVVAVTLWEIEAFKQDNQPNEQPLMNDHYYSVKQNDEWALENGYTLLGIVGYVPEESNNPVYRVFNPDSSTHELQKFDDYNYLEASESKARRGKNSSSQKIKK